MNNKLGGTYFNPLDPLDKKILSFAERFPKMTADELTEHYKSCVSDPLEDDDKKLWWMSISFDYEFSNLFSCYDIADILRKHGVVTKGIQEDHESSCCYFYFKTRAMADSFSKRLATFIVRRREIAKEWGINLD